MASSQPRSTDPRDYQRLQQAVAAMAKGFADRFLIEPHSHARDQLLYAVSGTMRIRTASETWIVPPDRAVYIPADVVHSVAMRGPVEMRTLYIDRRRNPDLPSAPVVIGVTPLLKALVLALLDEPIDYGPDTRAHRLAMLIIDEIVRATPLEMSIPMPRDRRLLRLCETLIETPALPLTLDEWADRAGASRRTLARLFRLECQMTFAAWRQRVRFHAAMEALRRGASIGEAARQQGYRSASAFSAAFRRAFGVTPSTHAGDAEPGR